MATDVLTPSWLYFDTSHEASSDTAVAEAVKPRKKRMLVCAGCNNPITDDSQRIDRRGTHEHSFFNPHGIVFIIGCFAQAEGCTGVGENSSEFSWFPGYLWRVSCCRNCGSHLGWRFSNGVDSFHGLILDKLADGEMDDDK